MELIIGLGLWGSGLLLGYSWSNRRWLYRVDSSLRDIQQIVRQIEIRSPDHLDSLDAGRINAFQAVLAIYESRFL